MVSESLLFWDRSDIMAPSNTLLIMVGVVSVLGWVSAAMAERFDFQFLGEPWATIRFTGGD